MNKDASVALESINDDVNEYAKAVGMVNFSFSIPNTSAGLFSILY